MMRGRPLRSGFRISNFVSVKVLPRRQVYKSQKDKNARKIPISTSSVAVSSGISKDSFA
jgi:hypothetical protein